MSWLTPVVTVCHQWERRVSERQDASSGRILRRALQDTASSVGLKLTRPDTVSSGSRLHKLYRKIIYINSDYPTVHTRKKIEKPPVQRGPTAVLGMQT